MWHLGLGPASPETDPFGLTLLRPPQPRHPISPSAPLDLVAATAPASPYPLLPLVSSPQRPRWPRASRSARTAARVCWPGRRARRPRQSPHRLGGRRSHSLGTLGRLGGHGPGQVSGNNKHRCMGENSSHRIRVIPDSSYTGFELYRIRVIPDASADVLPIRST